MYQQQQQQPFQTGVQSQYQGYKPAYQPVGFVQSYYQRPETTGYQGTGIGVTGTQSYQLPNYRGNQSGHDQYLRSDSMNPSGVVNTQSYQTQNYRGNEPGHDQYLRSDSMNPSGTVATQSYQTQNYRGNQPGHDQYLRSDSTQPTGGFQTASFNQGGYGQTQFPNQFVQTGTQSYQLPNYRGNQPGHDQYLRSDSQQPTGFGQYR